MQSSLVITLAFYVNVLSLCVQAVGKILSGLAQCGAWGCFDEFNRIDASVLSVISSQIQTIRNALILHLNRFYVSLFSYVGPVINIYFSCMHYICITPKHLPSPYTYQFEGQEINLDDRIGIFITMNPGYAGRTELPESVKALFRPVVVIVPDLQQICEIMLFSEGFLMAKVPHAPMNLHLISFAHAVSCTARNAS